MKLLTIAIGLSTASAVEFAIMCNRSNGLFSFVEHQCKWINAKLDESQQASTDCQVLSIGGEKLTENELRILETDFLYQQQDALACFDQFRSQLGEYMTSIPNLENLRGYGCWCTLDSGFLGGYGQPINGIDALCKDLVENYRCVEADAIARNRACPFQWSNYTISLFTDDALRRQFCTLSANAYTMVDSNYDTQCAIDRCQVDSEFIAAMFNNALDPTYQFDIEPKWTEYGGDFIRSDNCRQNRVKGDANGSNLGPRQCCGRYPDRAPLYHHSNGCCNENIYNKRTMECCRGTEIKPFGVCV